MPNVQRLMHEINGTESEFIFAAAAIVKNTFGIMCSVHVQQSVASNACNRPTV